MLGELFSTHKCKPFRDTGSFLTNNRVFRSLQTSLLWTLRPTGVLFWKNSSGLFTDQFFQSVN